MNHGSLTMRKQGKCSLEYTNAAGNWCETTVNWPNIDNEYKKKINADQQSAKPNWTSVEHVVFELNSGQPTNIRPLPVAPQTIPPVVPSPAPPAITPGNPALAAPTAPAVTAAAAQADNVVPQEFYNPYNFVHGKKRAELAAEPDIPTGLGGDQPFGHHTLHQDLFTGSITIKLKTATPLLIIDAETPKVAPNGHPTFEMSKDSDGKPLLRPTSVKGVLSSCFEAITNSRLRMFGKHDVRLGTRINTRRTFFDRAPRELTHTSLLPAKTIGELSPADRVFGWVHDDADTVRSGNRDAVVAHKGQLRIGNVECITPANQAVETFGRAGIPLTILSTPKPSQASFYVMDASGRPVQVKNSGYKHGQQIRHRKVYPHHKNLGGKLDYWNVTPPANQTQEFRTAAVGDKQRTDQNRSISEWVKIGTEFTCTIHVTNLSKVELGALLWMLSLDEHYEQDGEKHFLRMGGAKPLGFGSVSCAIASTDLRSGKDWKLYYLDLDNDADKKYCVRQEGTKVDAIAAYKLAVAKNYGTGDIANFEAVEFIAAFLGCCRGFDGPVHYPRKAAHRDGNDANFKWFTDNQGQYLELLTTQTPRLRYQ